MNEHVEPPGDRVRDRYDDTARRPRRRVWPWLLLLVAIGVLLWHPWSRHRATRQAASPPTAVAYATARTGDMPVVLTELGTVTPLAVVTVQSQISGYLLSVDFREGQDVAKGQLLDLIDPRPYEATLAQYEAQLARDTATWEQAKMDLARYQQLGRQNSIAKQTLQDQVFTVAQDAATLRVDQAEIETQKLDIAYCHVKAPVDGRVGLRQVDAGNYVTSSETNGLVVVTQLKPISVIFTIAEDNIQPVLLRMAASGTPLAVDAYDRTDTIRIAAGTLETIDNQVDTSTGTVKLRALFPNPSERLFPNEFVNAHLLLNTLHDVVLVPDAAVQTGPDGAFVYRIVPRATTDARAAGAPRRHDGTTDTSGASPARDEVVITAVKTGDSDGTDTVIVSGLAAGDRVVTEGVDRLKDNAPVTLVGASGTGTGTAAHGTGRGEKKAAQAPPAASE